MAADKKAASFQFVSQSFQNKKPCHFFSKVEDVFRGQGKCKIHGGKGKGVCSLISGEDLRDADRPDLAIAGFPCQPFSKARVEVEGGTAKQGRASQHPGYHLTLEGFPQYLHDFRPRGFILDQVHGFSDKSRELDGLDGDTFLEHFAKKCSDLYLIRMQASSTHHIFRSCFGSWEVNVVVSRAR